MSKPRNSRSTDPAGFPRLNSFQLRLLRVLDSFARSNQEMLVPLSDPAGNKLDTSGTTAGLVAAGLVEQQRVGPHMRYRITSRGSDIYHQNVAAAAQERLWGKG